MLDFVELIADRDRAAGRHQVRGRQPGVLGPAGQADGGAAWARRPRRRLRQHRRRRGRHRRRPAGLHRLGRLSLPDRVRAGLRPVRPGRAHRRRGLPRRRQARPARERRRGLRAGRRRRPGGREAMFALGCIQAQRCHTDHCPTGVATQNAEARARPGPGLEVASGCQLRGRPAPRPAQGLRGGGRLPPRPDRPGRRRRGRPAAAAPRRCAGVYGYEPGWGELGPALREEIIGIMAGNLPTAETPPTR